MPATRRVIGLYRYQSTESAVIRPHGQRGQSRSADRARARRTYRARASARQQTPGGRHHPPTRGCARREPFHTLHFPDDCLTLIERYGRLPLPPYIEHDPDATDEMRYQTIFAKHSGAVAAPTAGLHFDDTTFEALEAHGIRRATLTLHVGAGTFQPVRVNNLAEHKMHREWYQLPQSLIDQIAATQAAGRAVIAVGTTSMRALEAAARDADRAQRALTATAAETDIFITPGYRFQIVDRLVTNFHLPKSTLLMLVSAFAGMQAIRFAYRHAIEQRYRFFSYGDAMLLTRKDNE